MHALDAPSAPHASSAPAPAPSGASSSSAGPAASLGPCEDAVPGKVPPAVAPTLPPHLAKRTLGFDTSTPAPMKTLRDAGFAFTYVQAAIGAKKNQDFRGSFDLAKRCGLPRGAYQFISGNTDGAVLARTFLEVVEGDPGELAPALDLERPTGCKDECCDEPCSAWTGRVSAWLDQVEKKTGRRAMLYTVEPFFTKCLCASPKWKDRPLWLAAWPLFDFPKKPRVGGFRDWSIYQFEGNVIRFGGVIDLNVLGEQGLDPLRR
jgi:lysozyme